jgi:hypothetical protein
MIMKALRDAVAESGRMLTRDAILKVAAKSMRDYRIPVNLTSWRGR